SCGFDTLGVGVAPGAGATWFFTLNFGCSSPDGACACGAVTSEPAEGLDDVAPALPGPDDVIPQSAAPTETSIDVAAFEAGDAEDRCRDPVTADCTNRNAPAPVRGQSALDKDAACPTSGLVGSGLSMAEIANQIATCINAYRELPDAFRDDLPCEYSFRQEVVQPPRTSLAFARQFGDVPSQPLDISSTKHSRDMATQNFFAHDSLDGRKFSDRILAEGWMGFPIGENIAAGFQNIRSTVMGWVCSAGHRKNLMSCGYDTMGTGVAYNPSSDFKLYFTQNFGCTAPGGDCKCGQVVAPPAPAAPTSVPPASPPPAPSPVPATTADVNRPNAPRPFGPPDAATIPGSVPGSGPPVPGSGTDFMGPFFFLPDAPAFGSGQPPPGPPGPPGTPFRFVTGGGPLPQGGPEGPALPPLAGFDPTAGFPLPVDFGGSGGFGAGFSGSGDAASGFGAGFSSGPGSGFAGFTSGFGRGSGSSPGAGFSGGFRTGFGGAPGGDLGFGFGLPAFTQSTPGNGTSRIAALFNIIAGNATLLPLLQEPDIAGVFHRRTDVDAQGGFFSGSKGDAADDRDGEVVVGDPLVLLDPDATERPVCLGNASSVECMGEAPPAPVKEMVDPEVACPSTMIPGSNISGVEWANRVEICINAYREDPDAFAEMLPCAYSFRQEVMLPRRQALKTVNATNRTSPDPLDRAAMAHTLDLSSSGFMFGHMGSDGLGLDARLKRNNFSGYPIAEIIAGRHYSVRELVGGLLCYPRHRDIVMSCAYDSMGAGLAIDEFSPLDVYLTLNFGCSAPDGNCRCSHAEETPTGVGSETLAVGPQVCAASSEVVEMSASDSAEGNGTSPGAAIHALGMTVFGKQCVPTIADSQALVPILIQFPSADAELLPSMLSVNLTDFIGEPMELVAPSGIFEARPVRETQNSAWSAKLRLPPGFLGMVQVTLQAGDGPDAQPFDDVTLTFQRKAEAEVMARVAAILGGGDECP
ncbi:unnamed protein product, partial [Ostreobium quekettii]